jgi:hypothetical protein
MEEKEYRQLKTPNGRTCFVREVETGSGRRWQVRVEDRKEGPPTFFLWADKHIPANMDQDGLMLGVLRAVDVELQHPRKKMAPDYDSPILPDDFKG